MDSVKRCGVVDSADARGLSSVGPIPKPVAIFLKKMKSADDLSVFSVLNTENFSVQRLIPES